MGTAALSNSLAFFSAIIAVDEVIRQPRTLTDSIARLGNLQLRTVTQHIDQPRLVHPSRRQKLYGESSSILRFSSYSHLLTTANCQIGKKQFFIRHFVVRYTSAILRCIRVFLDSDSRRSIYLQCAYCSQRERTKNIGLGKLHRSNLSLRLK